jgi:hypothetical protein
MLRKGSEKILDGTTGDSRLTTQAIHLDKWSVMNVALAKAPFMDTTICEMFVYVGGELGCLDAMYKTKLEDASQKFKSYLAVVKAHITEDTNIEVKRTFYTLEYAVAIHGIFISCLMNAGFSIDKSNIDDCEKSLQEHLEFFETWRAEKNSERSFIAGKTYRNLLLVTKGFLLYAGYVLHQEDGPK